ncbi:MAG TPA: hypothetical protein PLZ36_06895 [Armatimonadota bacterium]|nr:hypothetical protein [Armatimonadota bacterium]HOS43202.1 hypothetical protein [Armatimonadota bacterium]
MGLSHLPRHWKGHAKRGCRANAQPPFPEKLLPFILLIPLATLATGIIGVLLVARITRALETIALTGALDELDDRLSDGERADLELRIREKLFG